MAAALPVVSVGAAASPVTLDTAQSSTVSVRYATADGTAVAGADYEAASGVVRFAPGETAKTVFGVGAERRA